MKVVLNIPVERWGRLVAPVVRSRWKWPLAIATLGVLVVFGIGLVSLSRTLTKARFVTPAGQNATPRPSGSNTGPVSDANDQFAPASQIDFGYYTPKLDPDWDYDAGSLVYDQTKGVVRYSLKFHNNNVNVVITQQAMPAALMPRGSDAFAKFINDNKVTRSQDVSTGTIYFLPALKNGVLGSGADTVIFASDSVLLFGKADSFVGYDPWLKLMSAMQIAK